LGRGWGTLTGSLGIVASSGSRATMTLGLVPWAEAGPALCTQFSIFLFSFTFSEIHINLQNM
jgi:hypothetical protein